MILPKLLWGEVARQDFARHVEALIEKNGGPEGVSQRMRELGMGRMAQSWMMQGPFEPITGSQLHELFGTGVLRALAAKLDMLPRDLVRQLSQVLGPSMARLASGKKHH